MLSAAEMLNNIAMPITHPPPGVRRRCIPRALAVSNDKHGPFFKAFFESLRSGTETEMHFRKMQFFLTEQGKMSMKAIDGHKPSVNAFVQLGLLLCSCLEFSSCEQHAWLL